MVTVCFPMLHFYHDATMPRGHHAIFSKLLLFGKIAAPQFKFPWEPLPSRVFSLNFWWWGGGGSEFLVPNGDEVEWGG